MELLRRIATTLRQGLGSGRDRVGASPRIFYIKCPNYNFRSSGVRALFLLCHHLNRLGYQAYVTGSGGPAKLSAPHIGMDKIRANRRKARGEIVVYPEVFAGNPLRADNVVRYILNKPGNFTGVGMEGFGPDDFFIHFAEEFRPDSRPSFELTLPVVDRNVYRQGHFPRKRRGFLLYSDRCQPQLESLPPWVSPYEIVSMKVPRSHAELAERYRTAEALIICERTAAIGEAIQCGCPVIIAPHAPFQYQPIVERYRGNGIAVGWEREELRRAQSTVAAAKRTYWKRFRHLDANLHQFVKLANEHFDNRASISSTPRVDALERG
jgi:hypothetical protein